MAYSSISKPESYFNTKLFTGTNGSGQAITGVGFQPDMIWIKHRTDVSDHVLTDAVRGVTKYVRPNAQDAETTNAQAITAFGADGFTHGTLADIDSTGNVCSWNWKAGTTSGLSGGTITPSSYSINTTSGFGIYKYTGTGSAGSIAHGLGSTPKMMIVKCTSHSDTWAVYHANVGATKYMELDTTAAQQTSSVPWNDTAPTDSLFTVGTWSATNGSSKTYVAYCFVEKKGYSKFGQYTGNGNDDGTFIYLGFKPAWFMIKSNSNAEAWEIGDNKRDTENVVNNILIADSTGAETAGTSSNRLHCDFLSNGVKLRGNASQANQNGSTYIYMAFAEEPLVANVGSSIPATAR